MGGTVNNKDSRRLPLPDAKVLFHLLKDNDATSGTSEQKALILRRRFDYILRLSIGGYGSETNFYSEGLKKVLKQMRVPNGLAKEMDQMRHSFNHIMHTDVNVDEKRYRLLLGRMATFVSIVTAQPIPREISEIIPAFSTPKNQRQPKKAIPIVCCIDACAIPDVDSRNSFNHAALLFRENVLSDSRMKGTINFKFVVSRDASISVRDMGNGDPEIIGSNRPKEDSIVLSGKEFTGNPSGILMLLMGGKSLEMTTDENVRFRKIRQSVTLYPIALPTADAGVFGNLDIGQEPIRMREDCFDEFFSWLFDSILIQYIK